MMNLNLSPTQLHLAVAAFTEKIDWLDAEHRRLVALAFAASRAGDFAYELDTNRVMRRTYAAMVTVIERELAETVRVEQAIERISADFRDEIEPGPDGDENTRLRNHGTLDEDDPWTNREGQPEFNGAFR